MKWNLTISFKKIFIIFILIQPILDEYGILNVSGSISDISLLYSLPIIVFMLIFKLKSQMNRFNLQYLPFFCWLIISLLVTLTTNTFNLGDIFNDYLRTLLYYFIVIFIINQYMDVRFAKRALEVLSLFLGAYCLLQYIFMFLLHINLPSYLPFWQHRGDLDFEQNFLNYTQYYRPHAIFSEPAHFCEYILIYLAVLLFGMERTNKRLVKIIFITAVLFVTGSSTGIVGAVILFGIYFIMNIRKHYRINILRMTIFVFAFVCVGIIVLKTDSFQIFITRFFVNQSSIEGRLGNIMSIFDSSVAHLLFGYGLRYDVIVSKFGWLPGYGLCFVYFGTIGLVLYIVSLVLIYRNVRYLTELNIAVFILFVILNAVTEVMFATYLLVYAIFIFGDSDNEEYECWTTGKRDCTRLQKRRYTG